jgi:hypothetical protein
MVELRSKSVDLDLIYEVAKVNQTNAIQMIVLYLKLLQKNTLFNNERLDSLFTTKDERARKMDEELLRGELEYLHKTLDEINKRLMKLELSYYGHFHRGEYKTSLSLNKKVQSLRRKQRYEF